MPARGNHSRTKTSRLARGIAAVGTGSIALALPLMGATAANAAQPTQSVAAAHTITAAQPLTYTVVAGDSLVKIAKEHAVSGGWRKLYADNRQAIGNDPKVIHPGLKLTLGTKAKSAPAAKPATATAAVASAVPASAKTYANNLDGWIKESLDVMAAHGIPGSYNGIYRNVMRESSGNPQAINNWDSNAAAGIPSKGLLQVIDPTFRAYHVPGTANDPYDPVANITAACNYAAAKYGSIDNVNGAY